MGQNEEKGANGSMGHLWRGVSPFSANSLNPVLARSHSGKCEITLILTALGLVASRTRCPYVKVGAKVHHGAVQKLALISHHGCTLLVHVHDHGNWGEGVLVREEP